MKSWIPWILLLGALAFLIVIGLAMLNSVERATQPVVDFGNQISTEVAQVLHPTPTILPDPVTIVREVRALARLETIEYTVEKVITAETGQGAFGFLFGDRLLLVAHGYVIAGVDLDKLGPEDVSFDEEGRVYISLPPAEVFAAALDNEDSYVYDRETGLLTKGEITLEATARQAAEDEILAAALEDGILEQAETNAENYLYRFLRSLGFSDVFFVAQEDLPD
jgi:HAMP domain-containing protein